MDDTPRQSCSQRKIIIDVNLVEISCRLGVAVRHLGADSSIDNGDDIRAQPLNVRTDYRAKRSLCDSVGDSKPEAALKERLPMFIGYLGPN